MLLSANWDDILPCGGGGGGGGGGGRGESLTKQYRIEYATAKLLMMLSQRVLSTIVA